jgi:hypothetical protein
VWRLDNPCRLALRPPVQAVDRCRRHCRLDGLAFPTQHMHEARGIEAPLAPFPAQDADHDWHDHTHERRGGAWRNAEERRHAADAAAEVTAIDRGLQGVASLGLTLHGLPSKEDAGERLGALVLLEQGQ